MRKPDWINLGILVIAIASGIAYLGHLEGRVDALQPTKIESVAEEAVQKITQAAGIPILDKKQYSWKQGQSEVQMIRVAEGPCYIVYVSGRFQGEREAVSIHIKGDYWFLGGQSEQRGVAAGARCWRWRTP